MNERTEVKFNSREILESLDAGDPYLRRNFIGASDTPIIMGLSTWKTPFELWREKSGLVQPESTDFIKEKGHEKEILARNKFEEIYQFDMKPKRIFSDKYDFMMSSLDGYNDKLKIGLEIKFVGKDSLNKSYEGIIPDYYFPQLQKQMYVADQELWYYMAYIDNENFMIIECKRDEEFIKKMIKAEVEFWECIQTATPPELTERDYVKREDVYFQFLAVQFKEIQEYKKQLLQKEENIRQLLIGNSNESNCEGFGIRMKKIRKKGSIEYSRIPELNNINLNKYRKEESEYWKISLVGEEE